MEDFLFSNEQVDFSTEAVINYAGDTGFQLFLTDQRVILYARRFKRDHVISLAIIDISEIEYKEKGLFKTGYVHIQSEKRNLDFSGKPKMIKEIVKVLQNKLETRKIIEEKTGIQVNVQQPSSQTITKEKYVRQNCLNYVCLYLVVSKRAPFFGLVQSIIGGFEMQENFDLVELGVVF